MKEDDETLTPHKVWQSKFFSEAFQGKQDMFKIQFSLSSPGSLDCRFKTESKVLQKVTQRWSKGHFHKLEEAG